MPSNKTTSPQKITFVGSGQVTAVLTALIASQNRKIKEEGGQPVEISILGKDGSESLRKIKEDGITIYCKETPKSAAQEIKIEPSEFQNLTHDTTSIGYQDHVFVATKACDLDDNLITKINSLKKQNNETDQATTITFAQNGVPFWLLATLPDNTINQEFRSDALTENSVIEDDGTEEAKEKRLIVDSKKLVKQIGKENIVGCVLNLACSVKFDGEGNPIYGHYNLSTPISEIGLPMKNIDGRQVKKNSNMINLYNVFGDIEVGNSKIDIGVLEGDIRKEVFYKLQVNAAVNGLCTIYRKNIGEVIGDKESEKIALKTSMQIEKIFSKLYPGSGSLRNSYDLEKRLERSFKHPTTMQNHFRSGEKIETESIYKIPTILAKISGLEIESLLVPIAECLDKMIEIRDGILAEQENKILSAENLNKITEETEEERKSLKYWAERIRTKTSDSLPIPNEQRTKSSLDSSNSSRNSESGPTSIEETPSPSPRNPSFFANLFSCFRYLTSSNSSQNNNQNSRR